MREWLKGRLGLVFRPFGGGPKRRMLWMAVALGLVMVACGRPTYRVDIFQEMHYSQSYRSQEPPRLQPPQDSVPITGKDVSYTPEEAKKLTNPLPRTIEIVEKGSSLYSTNCAMCHGAAGQGDGAVADFLVKWKYGSPPDLTQDATQNRTDGDIFRIITFTLLPGRSPMPEFGKLLSEEERWTLVHFVRSLVEQ